MSELPTGWVETSIGEVTKPFESIDPGRSPETWVDYIDIGSIDNATQRIADPKRFLGRDAPSRARRLVETGDVLFSTVRTYLKNIARVPPELDGALTSTGIALLRPSEALESSYLFHWVCSAPYLEGISKAQDGTMYPAVSDRDVSASSIMLPPLAEQRRIVAKLDALTARTARARADLDRIPALAARYKQAVLAKAFSGELTAEWRKAAAGPEPWQEVSIGEIAAITSGFGFPKDRQGLSEGDYPFAKVSDISKAVTNDGGMLSKATNYVRKADLVSLRAKPVPVGSVVFAKIGEALRLNRRAMATTEVILDNNCMALSPDVSRITPRFLYQFMRTVDLSPFAVATAVPSVRRGDVASLKLPLPPMAEQIEIDRRIEVAFSEIDRIAAEAASARRLLDHLDKAVLAKAFHGELVPQDPTDEPASVLLDRIKAEREAGDRKPRSRSGRRLKGPKEQVMKGKQLSPRERILEDSENWPTPGLPFEAIATRTAMPHDQLRDALFELLAGSSPALQQRFDTDAELMMIQRVAA